MIKTSYSEFRALDKKTKRLHKEEEHPMRNKFSRDRDRILYSKEFRRLAGKTQVFVVGFDDNQRTRLTHTLEVAQISKTITKILGLNIELSEAISYGHDVGHTPFGHVGERTLNYIMNNCDNLHDHYEIEFKNTGFKHNWQGIRVVSELEKISDKFDGLNLTEFTLWGILNHSDKKYSNCKYSNNKDHLCNLMQKNKNCEKERVVTKDKKGNSIDEAKLDLKFYDKYDSIISDKAWSFEGLIVKIADEIAQRHHDTEDSLLAGLFGKKELFKEFKNCFNDFIINDYRTRFFELENHLEDNLFINYFTSFVVDFLITNLIKNTQENLNSLKKKYELETQENFYAKKEKILNDYQLPGLFKIVNYEKKFAECEEKFKKIIWNRILLSHLAQSMDGKSKFIIRRLFKAFTTNPQQLPDNTISKLFNRLDKKKYKDKNIGEKRNYLNELHYGEKNTKYINILHRTITDFIAGSTDSFAIKMYSDLYGTKQVFNNNKL